MTNTEIDQSHRGYFEIGIYCGKNQDNLGTLWRSAYQLGAAGIFTIGNRHAVKQCSDTYKAWRHLPYRRFDSLDQFLASQPYDCQLVGIEFPGKDLATFNHPERAIYLLGAEDNGLSPVVLGRCQSIVQLPSFRRASYNVAVAGSIVMYDRLNKRKEPQQDNANG